MLALRSLLFMLAAVPLTALFGLLVTLAVPLSTNTRYAIITVWRYFFMGLVRCCLGIRMEIKGKENIPAEASIVLSKHQSAFETVALQDVFPSMVFVMKRELLRLPFFGWALGSMKMISIDRGAGKAALEQLVTQGKERLGAGVWVTIFPEGTRVAPGHKKRYKPGGAHLAVQSGALVVPVAHNAGEVWPRQAFLKKPGVVTFSIGPAIDPKGLSEAEVNSRVEAWIEAEMQRLSPHRYPHGDQSPA